MLSRKLWDSERVTLEECTLPSRASINIVFPLAISKDNAAKVQVLLDQNLVGHTRHPSDASETVFIHSEKLHSYLYEAKVKVTIHC